MLVGAETLVTLLGGGKTVRPWISKFEWCWLVMPGSGLLVMQDRLREHSDTPVILDETYLSRVDWLVYTPF